MNNTSVACEASIILYIYNIIKIYSFSFCFFFFFLH
nr:MAG TPA: hypothetical protein [Caudoviricetes sp.]